MTYRRALSFRQPWLFAVQHLGKRVENRSWNSRYRGEILLHAARACTTSELDHALRWMYERELINWGTWPGLESVPRGGICGRAWIVAVIPPGDEREAECAANLYGVDLRWWMRDKYGFVLADVAELPFRPWSGSLGLFRVPDVAAEERAT